MALVDPGAGARPVGLITTFVRGLVELPPLLLEDCDWRISLSELATSCASALINGIDSGVTPVPGTSISSFSRTRVLTRGTLSVTTIALTFATGAMVLYGFGLDTTWNTLSASSGEI